MTNDAGSTYHIDIVARFEEALKGVKRLEEVSEEAMKAIEDSSDSLEQALGTLFDDAVIDANKLRVVIEALKSGLITMASEGKASIDDLANALSTTIKEGKLGENLEADDLKRVLDAVRVAGREAKAELEEMGKEAERAAERAKSLDVAWDEWRGGIDSAKAALGEQVNKGRELEQAFVFLKEQYKLRLDDTDATAAIKDLTSAYRELRKEPRELEKAQKAAVEAMRGGFGDSVEAGQRLVQKTLEVRDALKKLVATGLTIDQASEALKRSNAQLAIMEQFSGAEIAGGTRMLKEEAKLAAVELKQMEKAIRDFGSVADFGKPEAGARTYRANIEQIKREMLALRAASNLTLDDITVGFRKSGDALGYTSAEISQAKSEIQSLDKAAQQTTGIMAQLDKVSSTFFGFTLATLATDALRRVVQLMGDLIERGRKVSEAFFNMAVAVRGLQRIGTDITFAEVNEQVDRLGSRFSFFTETEIRGGLGQILLLTRNLKLTKEEMFALSEATASLAIVTGKDFAEEGLLVARAIASGYTEALQRAGIEASRFTITQEAARLGINKAFNAMTQAERAAVTLGLVLDQVGNIEEDVARKSETLDGRVRRLEVIFKEIADEAGQELLLLLVSLVEPIVDIIAGIRELSALLEDTSFKTFSDNLSVTRKLLSGGFLEVPFLLGAAAVEHFTDTIRILKGELEATDVRSMGEILEEKFGRWWDDLRGRTGEDLAEDITKSYVAGSEYARLFGDANEEAAEEAEDSWGKVIEKVEDLVVGFQRAADDIELALTRAFDDIETKLQRKLEDIAEEEALVLGATIDPELPEGVGLEEGLKIKIPGEIDLEEIEALKEIDEKFRRKFEDLDISFQQKREEIVRSFNEKIRTAQEKFREKEIQAQIEFQERQRKLREGFLFDLDDALRERDAKQVLQLTRQFNLENRQLTRENDIAAAERERQFQLELNQLARQRAIRLQELDIEFEQKRAQLALQKERERADAQADFQREREEAAEKFDQQRQDAEERAEQERADAELRAQRQREDNLKRFNRRIADLRRNLSVEEKALFDHGMILIDIASDTAIEVNKAFSSIVGSVSVGLAALQAFDAYRRGRQNYQDYLLQDGYSSPDGNAKLVGDQVYVGGQAEGGTIVARKPTVAIFGEAGPEAATFTPLNRSGKDVNKVFNGYMPNKNSGGGSSMIRIYLDEGLRGDIINQALDDVATVIVEEIRR